MYNNEIIERKIKDGKNYFHVWLHDLSKYSSAKNTKSTLSEREIWVKNSIIPLKAELEELYASGYGYKAIAKLLEVSPIILRAVIQRYLDVEYRKGVFCTDRLKLIRSENAKRRDKNPFCNWPEKYPDMHINKKPGRSTGIQGYYKSISGKYHWLRSTWEYIYAKWLDGQPHLSWCTEKEQFVLSNGEKYRPDFFIINKNTNEEHMVEIKGTFYAYNRSEKPKLLKEQGYNITIVEDVAPYIKTTYKEELKKWKTERLLKVEL